MSDWTSEAEARLAAPNDTLLAEAVAEIERLRAERDEAVTHLGQYGRDIVNVNAALRERAEAAEAEFRQAHSDATDARALLRETQAKLAEAQAGMEIGNKLLAGRDRQIETLTAKLARVVEIIARHKAAGPHEPCTCEADVLAAAKASEEHSYWNPGTPNMDGSATKYPSACKLCGRPENAHLAAAKASECGCPVPDCQHHRGLVPYPAAAKASEAEAKKSEDVTPPFPLGTYEEQ